MPAKTSRFAMIDQQLAAQRRPTCKLCLFLEDAPKPDAEYIEGMFRDGRSGGDIAKVLAGGGVDVGSSSVKRHRQFHS